MKDEIQNHSEIAIQAVKSAARVFKSNRPLFIIVQYDHEGDKAAFVDKLQEIAEQQGLATRSYDPQNKPEHSSTYLYNLVERDVTDNTLSLVISTPKEKDSNDIDWDFISYINLHRDRIVHRKLRFFLFLHQDNMADFIDDAGDLWSFRHKTFRLERVPE